METTFDAAAGRAVSRWAWFVLVAALATLWLVLFENGAVLRAGAGTAHELFHDGRHFFGMPCH